MKMMKTMKEQLMPSSQRLLCATVTASHPDEATPCASQSHFLFARVAVGCRSHDGGGGGGLLDGGEADVGGAVQVAGLTLGAGTSAASQLTGDGDKRRRQSNEIPGQKTIHQPEQEMSLIRGDSV